MPMVYAETKPATKSKINKTALILAGVAILGLFGIEVPEDMIANFDKWVILTGAIVTAVLRTWFNKTVTP